MRKALAVLVACAVGAALYAQPTREVRLDEKHPPLELVGYGSDTKGGMGGTIIKVTNLHADGEGSFKAALEAEGPRIIVFEVGGVIDLEKQQIKVRNPYVTIAGQTAPSPGITCIRGGLTLDTHDIIMQHIRFRMGDAGAEPGSGYEPEISTSAHANAYNIIIDHCSVSWGVDENLSVSGTRGGNGSKSPHDVTLSYNFISEGLRYSVHSKTKSKHMDHSMGTLVMDDVKRVAVIGNYYAHNSERNPWYKANSSGVVVNNLIYDPGTWAIRLSWIPKEWKNVKDEKPGTPVVSIVGNYEKEGPSTKVAAMVGSNYPENHESGYLEDNICVRADGTQGKVTDPSIPIDQLEQRPIWIEGLDVIPANEVPDYILKWAGARPADRDETDLRLIDEFSKGTGRIIDSQDEVGGYPVAAPTYRKLDVPDEHIGQWLEGFTEAVMGLR